MGRRNFTQEFKVSAVKLVLEQSYTVSEAAKSLGVDPSSLRSWLKQLSPEVGGNGASGQSAVQAELRRLREENKRLLMEREILKKATAFFARHPS
jgi:transposase